MARKKLTREEARQMAAIQQEAFTEQIRALAKPGTGGAKPGFSKRQVADLAAGFGDGFLACLRILDQGDWLDIVD